MMEDFVAAAVWLKSHAECTGKIGAIGFCFGGGIVNQLAVRLLDLGAAAPFYGRQPSAEDTAKIKAPIVAHYAGNDPRADQSIPAFRGGAQGEQQEVRDLRLRGPQHGFHNDTTPRYDEAAAKLAWQRSLDLFNKNLR